MWWHSDLKKPASKESFIFSQEGHHRRRQSIEWNEQVPKVHGQVPASSQASQNSDNVLRSWEIRQRKELSWTIRDRNQQFEAQSLAKGLYRLPQRPPSSGEALAGRSQGLARRLWWTRQTWWQLNGLLAVRQRWSFSRFVWHQVGEWKCLLGAVERHSWERRHFNQQWKAVWPWVLDPIQRWSLAPRQLSTTADQNDKWVAASGPAFKTRQI